MTALWDAAARVEIAARETATAADRFEYLGRMGDPDPVLAAGVYLSAVETVVRLADLMVLLGTAPDG